MIVATDADNHLEVEMKQDTSEYTEAISTLLDWTQVKAVGVIYENGQCWTYAKEDV